MQASFRSNYQQFYDYGTQESPHHHLHHHHHQNQISHTLQQSDASIQHNIYETLPYHHHIHHINHDNNQYNFQPQHYNSQTHDATQTHLIRVQSVAGAFEQIESTNTNCYPESLTSSHRNDTGLTQGGQILITYDNSQLQSQVFGVSDGENIRRENVGALGTRGSSLVGNSDNANEAAYTQQVVELVAPQTFNPYYEIPITANHCTIEQSIVSQSNDQNSRFSNSANTNEVLPFDQVIQLRGNEEQSRQHQPLEQTHQIEQYYECQLQPDEQQLNQLPSKHLENQVIVPTQTIENLNLHQQPGINRDIDRFQDEAHPRSGLAQNLYQTFNTSNLIDADSHIIQEAGDNQLDSIKGSNGYQTFYLDRSSANAIFTDQSAQCESFSSSASTSSSEESSICNSTRDEKKAREANIPIPYYDIVNLSIELFNEQLAKHNLTESQLGLIKDIRRRGKNKVAAQSCRKRKMEQISELQLEVNRLASDRRLLSREYGQLVAEHTEMVQKSDKLYAIIQEWKRQSGLS